MGGQVDSTPDLKAALEKLKTDFIAIQEIDYNLPRSGEINQIAEIAAAMGAADFCFAPAIIGTPGEKWCKLRDSDDPYVSNKSPGTNPAGGYGIAIASKIPVLSYERLDLGRSLIGMPLLISADKTRLIYVKDEPRVALIAHLENGWTVINTHLSFVPGVNLWQLAKIKRWIRKSGRRALIVGDLNMPFILGKKWRSLNSQKTYPSWKPAVQFDYILGEEDLQVKTLESPKTGISDHLPLTIEILEGLR